MVKLKKAKLDKGMFQEAQKLNMSFGQFLERVDPVGEYAGTPYEKLDAFERQLAARGLIVNPVEAALGASPSIPVSLETFYSAEDGGILFAEYISRMIFIGASLGDRFLVDDDLVYMTEEIDAQSVKGLKIEFDPTSVEGEMKRVAEGAGFSAVTLSTSEYDIPLYKYGRKILASYEALRRVRIDVIGVKLQEIGLNWALGKTALALGVIVNGNSGESNSAANTNTAGVWTESLLMDFYLGFPSPYTPMLFCAHETVLSPIFDLSGFKVNGTNLFLTEGMMPKLFNKPVKQLDNRVTTVLSTTKLLGTDTRFSLRKVKESRASLVEEEKIIDKQLEQAVISEVIAYVKDGDNGAETMTKTS